jgi:hypothetical protein
MGTGDWFEVRLTLGELPRHIHEGGVLRPRIGFWVGERFRGGSRLVGRKNDGGFRQE